MKVLPTVAYCMNLDSRTDRWEQVVKDFTRLQTVMPITIERVSSVANPKKPQEGVAATVHKIIIKAKRESLPYVLILEDDLFIIDPKKVKQCLENAPNNWDILSGGVYYYRAEKSWSEDWMKMKDFCSLHFIILRNTIYDQVLTMTGKSQHLDRLLAGEVRYGRMTMYLMHPMPCQQRPGFSNIRRRVVDDNRRKLPWIQNADTLCGVASPQATL
uniref:Uncharacterized protein n=1 Tax=Marseillevirus LCMAC201 TaxID=2506605 RepID=A0A481YVD7_9VIRU|nr:MAG: hypothetical protein LCMAC201_00700 [Marseillevirus LCMAC201]